jgi:hypothetical protein
MEDEENPGEENQGQHGRQGREIDVIDEAIVDHQEGV